MRKIIIVFLFVSGLINVYPQDFGDAKANKLYRSILAEGSLSDKKALGTQLGKMKIEPARKALGQLLEAESYWDRTAAVYGLFALNDPSAWDVLLERMFQDHMIASDIEDHFKSGMAVYYRFLAEKYTETAEKSDREKILDLIGTTKTPAGAQLLRNIIADDGSPDRQFAFKKLIACYKGNYALAKGYVRDGELREYALCCLLEEGSAQDLPAFMELLAKNEEPKLKIIAYQAVSLWAPPPDKKAVYLDALGEKDELLVRAGLLAFPGLFDDDIKARLIRLVKNAEYQATRLSAAERLAETKSPAVATYIIPVFKERYVEERSGTFLDFFAAMFTLGFSTLFDSLSRDMSRESFENRINKINASLQKTTGAYLPPSYQEWFDWAVYSGYTVDGANIIQYLFSSYPAVRLKAIDRSLRLLGFRDKKDFIDRNKTADPNDEKEISLAIAGQLIEKGFLKDEKY